MNEVKPVDYPIGCAVPGCNNIGPSSQMASLTDKNGAGWQICSECVDDMWARKPWSPPEDTPAPNLSAVWEREQLVIAMARFVGSMELIRQLMIDHEILTDKSGFAAAIQNSIDIARKAYGSDV